MFVYLLHWHLYSSWTQITGRGPSNSTVIFGSTMGPLSTPSNQLRFGYDGNGSPVPHLYSMNEKSAFSYG